MWNDPEVLMLLSLVVLVLGLVMMFAQVRLFSIDKTLKEIQAILAANNKSDKTASASANPLSIK